jgi:signal transduction histidine kinase
MSAEISKKELKVSFNHKDGNLPKVMVDGEKVGVVLQNVIENAVKYTPKGGVIEINFEDKDGFIQVSVKDSGIGISDEDQKNVFNRFFRAKNAIKVETDGSGLGLFITKGIVEKHGGKIWFKSKVGEGSTFYFTLPHAK